MKSLKNNFASWFLGAFINKCISNIKILLHRINANQLNMSPKIFDLSKFLLNYVSDGSNSGRHTWEHLTKVIDVCGSSTHSYLCDQRTRSGSSGHGVMTHGPLKTTWRSRVKIGIKTCVRPAVMMEPSAEVDSKGAATGAKHGVQRILPFWSRFAKCIILGWCQKRQKRLKWYRLSDNYKEQKVNTWKLCMGSTQVQLLEGQINLWIFQDSQKWQWRLI